MRLFAQAFNVLQAVARASSCAKGGGPDVHRIGPVMNGGNANVGIAGGG
jgi:hypothetical protein